MSAKHGPVEAVTTAVFEGLARLALSRPRAVLSAIGLVLLASVGIIAYGGALSTGETRRTEADVARRLIERELDLPGTSSFAVAFSHDTLTVDDPEFLDAMTRALGPLRANPVVARVIAPDDAPQVASAYLLSENYDHALAVVVLDAPYHEAVRLYPELRESIRAEPLDVTFTGWLAFRSDLDETLARDLVMAEAISLPLAFFLLLYVFRTFVSAFLPVAVGGLAVASGMAGILALSHVIDIPSYAINVVTLIGLGVAIDYSLFIVSRYRDELAAGRTYEEALRVAVTTVGRAVAFSGIAVGVGLSGLIFFQGSFLVGMGLAGAIVVLFAVVFALTFLPALLVVLGPKIHAGRVPWSPKVEGEHPGWRRIAEWTMRRPILVLLLTLAVLIPLAMPFRHLQVAQADLTVLPRDAEARRGWELIKEQFPDHAATQILVVARFPTSPSLTRPRAEALYDLSQQLHELEGVRDVQSVVDLGPMFGRDSIGILAETPAERLSEDIRFARDATVGSTTVVLTVLTDAPPASEEARALVRAIREHRHVADGEVLVTGQTADDLDVTEFVLERAPWAIAFVVMVTYVVLLLLLRSVFLPLKAVAMNFLSISASFGALVWIFQDGNLSGLLQFEAGPIDPALPVLLFCSVFGLSMDYEVLILTRIQEEYEKHGDNTRAVSEGLQQTGRLVTSAAAIMMLVFVAFSLASVVLVKAMGVGMALAVMLDATLVRVLIVPATMRLFGNLNWWAPRWLSRPTHVAADEAAVVASSHHE